MSRCKLWCTILLLLCPMKYHRLLDIGIQTKEHRACDGDFFQHLIAWQRCRHGEGSRQAGDFTGRGLGHFLGDLDFHAAQVNLMLSRVNSHGGRHASPQRRGHKVGRGKRFRLPVIIHRRIEFLSFLPGRTAVRGGAMQFTLISDCDFYHVLFYHRRTPLRQLRRLFILNPGAAISHPSVYNVW